jgi:hypothetical protein
MRWIDSRGSVADVWDCAPRLTVAKTCGDMRRVSPVGWCAIPWRGETGPQAWRFPQCEPSDCVPPISPESWVCQHETNIPAHDNADCHDQYRMVVCEDYGRQEETPDKQGGCGPSSLPMASTVFQKSFWRAMVGTVKRASELQLIQIA